MIYTPYNYQNHAFQHVVDNTHSGLFLDMGLGKTVITLTALNRLIYQDCEIDRALIIAPKHVTRTVWKQEAEKWDHLKHLKISIVWGSEKERIAALRVKADIYVINRENVVWLVQLFQSKFPFPMVVIDELSSFKSAKSQRFKSLRIVRKYMKRVVGLTGTPAPNSLIDLWAQLFLLDEGERLEKNITGYRERYFTLKNPGEMYSGYRPRKGAEQVIYDKISDICISMKARDYLDLPPLIENNIYLEMDEEVYAKYEQFEEDSIVELIQDLEVTAMNAAALTNKLLQFANGAVYHNNEINNSKEYTELHNTKLDALEEIIEEAQGNPVIVFYSYRHDLERIRRRFPHARSLKHPSDIVDWNLGKIELLVLHPASAGHGLNLQEGGHIMVWFGMNWSLELYQQAIARLMRQGQIHSVILHRLIMRHTMDEKVVKSLDLKERGQDALMEAVKALVNKYTNAA